MYMNNKYRFHPPFFEIGPKNYLYGSDVVDLARIADEAAKKYEIHVIFTAPYVNIAEIAAATENLYIFAPHMDPGPVGRGLADVLPEAIRAAGACGVMLNHTERPLTIPTLINTIDRARKLDLMTIVCATSISETQAIAELHPDMIVSEPLDLIGSGNAVGSGFVEAAMKAVHSVDKNIGVLVGGGVSNGEDAYKIIKAGADATGSSSAIALSENPEKTINEMLAGLRQAWNERAQAQKWVG